MEYLYQRKFSAIGAAMGTVAGLVSVTPACGFVSPMASTAIASIGAVSAFYGMRLKNFLGYDDALDVFACHGVAGVAGTVLTGCFASLDSNPNGDNGLFFGTICFLSLMGLSQIFHVNFKLSGLGLASKMHVTHLQCHIFVSILIRLGFRFFIGT